jgi:hypothetical protein
VHLCFRFWSDIETSITLLHLPVPHNNLAIFYPLFY